MDTNNKLEVMSDPTVQRAVRALEARIVSPSVTPAEWLTHTESERDARANEAEDAQQALELAKAEGRPTLVVMAKYMAAKRIWEAARDRYDLALAVANIADGNKTGQIFIDLPDSAVTISCIW